MRAFIILCLVAVAYTDKLGYNYQPVGHSDAGLSFQPGSGSGGSGSFGGGSGPSSGYGSSGIGSSGFGPSGVGSSGFGPSGAGSSGFGPSGFGSSGIGSSGVGSSNLGGPISTGNDILSGPAEFSKEFYTFSAPEGDFNDDQAAQQAANSLKKNLQVIFIRNPENRGLENAVLALARQAGEQRTAIYVLNKQTDIGDLANKLNVARSQNNQKPEVHFVKYRTPEDAANAQRAIQSQYDGLGGSSQSHNGGVAPVLNFASAAPARAGPAPQAPGNAYLPSSIFRLRH